jgi:hypothetical protein
LRLAILLDCPLRPINLGVVDDLIGAVSFMRAFLSLDANVLPPQQFRKDNAKQTPPLAPSTTTLSPF